MSERHDTADITLHFCALCNESIPQSDVDAGRAKRHKDRLVCATCDRAMSATHASEPRHGPAPGAPHPVAHAAPATLGGGVGGGVLVAVLALVVSIGGVLWARWQREQDRQVDDVRRSEDQAAWQRRVGESERALEGERSARASLESSLVAARAEWRRVADEARVASADETRKLGRELEALRGTLVELDERVAAAVSREELASLAGVASAAHAEFEALSKKVSELEARERAPAPPTGATDPVAAAQPTWFPIVQRLKSPDFSTRWSAVQELGEAGDPDVVDYLVPILQDADVFVRLATARVLGDLGSTKAVDGLIAALGDENSTVREEAYVSLRKLTKKDLSFDAQSTDVAERQRRIKAWQDWWRKAREDGSTP